MASFTLAVTGGTYALGNSAIYTPLGTPGPADTVSCNGTGATFTGTSNAGTFALGSLGECDISGGTFNGNFQTNNNSGLLNVTIKGTLMVTNDGNNPTITGCTAGSFSYSNSTNANVTGNTFNTLILTSGADYDQFVTSQTNTIGVSFSLDSGSTFNYLASASTDPGITNVKSGTNYSINGVSLTGTYSGGGTGGGGNAGFGAGLATGLAIKL